MTLSEYKLPHLLDRAGQPEAMDWILNSDKKYLIFCAPTGLGKTALAAAASIEFRTLALVLHKSLQSANYKEQYDFDILYGKSNYPCTEKNKKDKQIALLGSLIKEPYYTAYDCSNYDCECPYQQQYNICLNSQRVSLNYAKFLASKLFCTDLFTPCDYETGLDRSSFDKKYYNREFEPWPTYLFLDEAHNLPDIVMNSIGSTLDWNNEFLQSPGSIKPETEGRLNHEIATALFRQYARIIQDNEPEQEKNLVKWRKWSRLCAKIQNTSNALGNPKDWYYEATDKSLIIKPLTAKYHFKRLFGVADKVVLMSATITPNIAERLGLEHGEFDFYQVPNPWPVPSRLVYDLGGPAINYKSSEDDKEDQSMLIADVLSKRKSGIIHVTSKSQAYDLFNRLRKYNLSIHLPQDGIGTEKQYQEWCNFREPGTYCISWNFHEGVDLGDDDINIMAKTPYAGLGSNYEQAKLDYDPAWYLEKTAYSMEQLFGRHQRGIDEHYNGSKLAFIADSSWHRLKTHLSDDFKKRIRKWNG